MKKTGKREGEDRRDHFKLRGEAGSDCEEGERDGGREKEAGRTLNQGTV